MVIPEAHRVVVRLNVVIPEAHRVGSNMYVRLKVVTREAHGGRAR